MSLVCIHKISYGKDFGAYVVVVGEKVEVVDVSGTSMYKTKGGRYLAPFKYAKYFKEER